MTVRILPGFALRGSSCSAFTLAGRTHPVRPACTLTLQGTDLSFLSAPPGITKLRLRIASAAFDSSGEWPNAAGVGPGLDAKASPRRPEDGAVVAVTPGGQFLERAMTAAEGCVSFCMCRGSQRILNSTARTA